MPLPQGRAVSHWNHRITRETITNPDGSTEYLYGIREVYYDDDGNVTSWTSEFIAAVGDSIEDVTVTLSRMSSCIDRGVLDIDEA